MSITDDFLPSLTTSESARTEPGPRRYGVDRLDASGNLAGYLGCEGEVPVLLEPGDNHLFFRYEEIRAAGYEDNQSTPGPHAHRHRELRPANGPVTRFYFRADEVPTVTPAFHTGWDDTASALRRMMRTTKLAGDTVVATNVSGGAIGDDVLELQFTSPPLAAGLVVAGSGTTFGCGTYCLESSGNDNLTGVSTYRVVSQDGTTQRFASPTIVTASGGEFPFSGFPAEVRSFGFDGGTSDYVTVAGDRLVIELGHHIGSGATAPFTGQLRRGSDSTGLDADADSATSLTAVGFWEMTGTLTFLEDVLSPGGSERGLRIGLDAVIGWEIDGRPVEFTNDWQAEVQTGWGDRTLTASFSTDVTWAEQGSSVVGWKRSGEPLWQGTLVVDPRKDGDHYRIRAHGYADDMAENSTRLFYRTDGAEQWEDRGSDPYGYNQNEKYDLHQGRGSLQWKFGNNADAFATNDAAGFALWKEGGLISRYTATLTVNQALGGFDFLSRSFTGPDGTQSDITTQTLNFGGPLTLDVDTTINVANQEDGMTFVVIRTGASSTPNGRRRLGVTRIKVYGRTTDAAFSASDAVADVAALSGLGTDGIDSNPLVVLPLDWTDDHPGLLRLHGRAGRLALDGTGLGDDLRPLRADLGKRHRGRRGPKPRAGAPRQPLQPALPRPERRPADGGGGTGGGPVPRPGDRRVRRGAGGPPNRFGPSPRRWPRWRSSSRPASGHPARWSSPRSATSARRMSPYDVNAGDQLLLTDLAPRFGPQRIEAITYRPGGHATATLGSAFNLVATLAELERPPRKRRRKRRAGMRRAGSLTCRTDGGQ